MRVRRTMGIVLLGNRVHKFFPRYGWHRGTIVEPQPNDAYLVRFDDGCAHLSSSAQPCTSVCMCIRAHREEYTYSVPELLRILDGAAHNASVTPSSPPAPERKPDPQPDRAARKVATSPKSPAEIARSSPLSLPETPDEQPPAAATAGARKRPRDENEMSEYER